MPYEPHAVTNRDYSQIALNMSVVGTIMALILFASRLQWIPDLTVPAVTINMLAMFIMRIPRRVDDFVAELWTASASVALFVMAGVAQIAIAETLVATIWQHQVAVFSQVQPTKTARLNQNWRYPSQTF